MFGARLGLIVGLVMASLAACGSEPQLGPGTLRSSQLKILPMPPKAPKPPKPPDPCAGGATTGFVPTSMDIQDVGKGYPVIGLSRDGNDTPRTPPVYAKTTVAWDAPGNLPGGALGNVLFNTHTWPDGSALGNAMLAGTQVGDIITVHGADAKLCYLVTEAVRVDAGTEYGHKFWTKNGPPQMAIIVCSGRRRGPGDWSQRTIWYAIPYFGDLPNSSSEAHADEAKDVGDSGPSPSPAPARAGETVPGETPTPSPPPSPTRPSRTPARSATPTATPTPTPTRTPPPPTVRLEATGRGLGLSST